MTQWSDLERLIIQRWQDAAEFRDAVEATEEKLEGNLRRVGDRVAEWLKPGGFELWVEGDAAEFNAYRSSWVYKEEGGPVVVLSVGSLYPNGYRKVHSDDPYLGIYT